MPPDITIALTLLQPPSGASRAARCQLTLTRGALPTSGGATGSSSASSYSPAKLVCGCAGSDELLLLRSLVLETFASPLQVRDP